MTTIRERLSALDFELPFKAIDARDGMGGIVILDANNQAVLTVVAYDGQADVEHEAAKALVAVINAVADQPMPALSEEPQ